MNKATNFYERVYQRLGFRGSDRPYIPHWVEYFEFEHPCGKDQWN